MYANKLEKKKILLLQGENGRKLIEKKLTKKGYDVYVIECYKRVFKYLNAKIEAKKWRSYQINTIIVTSSEMVRKLYDFFSEVDRREWLLKCKILVVENRTAKMAEKLGWKDIIVAKYANNLFILKLIKKTLHKK